MEWMWHYGGVNPLLRWLIRLDGFVRFVSYLGCAGATFADARPPRNNPGNLTLDAAPTPSAPQPLLQRQEIDIRPGREAECVVIGVRRPANVASGRAGGPRSLS
jgi:hypothetical protein